VAESTPGPRRELVALLDEGARAAERAEATSDPDEPMPPYVEVTRRRSLGRPRLKGVRAVQCGRTPLERLSDVPVLVLSVVLDGRPARRAAFDARMPSAGVRVVASTFVEHCLCNVNQALLA